MPCRSSLRVLSRTASSCPTRHCPRGRSWRSTSPADRSKSHRSCRRNLTPGSGPARKPWNWLSGWRAKGRTMQRGEIWKVDIPFTPGHGQAGERPAVIVQDDPFIATLPTEGDILDDDRSEEHTSELQSRPHL